MSEFPDDTAHPLSEEGHGDRGKIGTRLPRAGDEIGPYKLLSILGEGGLGTVWLAERRRPFVQRVALKVIKAGMDTRQVLARFEQERQALAMMNHPNIAKVLDGGMTASGRPYFVMEYVRGDPITEFCDSRKLDVRERLVLFRRACDAVQHAHQKGVIHRDLTPRNILAFDGADGQPDLKVIDFGLAKAMDQGLTAQTMVTAFGQMVGTADYMSPEQADPTGIGVDTRTDIYSLGALLYEIVTGAKPFDLVNRALGEVQRIIQHDDPLSPSARLSSITTQDQGRASQIERCRATRIPELVRVLRSELEWIPLKAMRKEPQHRYQTAVALSDDIRNYLEGQPLVAAPESNWYRARKVLRRNRGTVAGIAAVFTSSMIGVVLSATFWMNATRAEADADRQRADAESAKEEANRLREEAMREREQANDFRTKAEDARLAADRAQEASRSYQEEAASLRKVAEQEQRVASKIRALNDLREALSAAASANAPLVERWEQRLGTETIPLDSFLSGLPRAIADRGHGVAVRQGSAFPSPICAIAVDNESSALASVDADGGLVIQDFRSGFTRQKINAGPGEPIAELRFARKGTQLIAMREDGTVQGWSREGEPRFTWSAPMDAIQSSVASRAIGESPEGNLLVAVASLDGKILIRSTGSGDLPLLMPPEEDAWAHTLAFDSRGSMLVAGTTSGKFISWNTKTGERHPESYSLPAELPRAIALAPNDRSIAIADDEVIHEFDVEVTDDGITWRNTIPATHKIASGRIVRMRYSPDGGMLAACSDSGVASLFKSGGPAEMGSSAEMGSPDLANGNSFQADSEAALDLEFCQDADGLGLLVAGNGGSVRARTIGPTGFRSTWRHAETHGKVTAIAHIPGSRVIVAGTADGRIRKLDLITGAQLGDSVQAHAGPIRALVVTDGGRTAISASEDRDIRTFDIATLTQPHPPLRIHLTQVLNLAIDVGGTMLASQDSSGTICITGLPDRRTIAHTTTVAQPTTDPLADGDWLRFAPSGNAIVARNSKFGCFVWEWKNGRQRPMGGAFAGMLLLASDLSIAVLGEGNTTDFSESTLVEMPDTLAGRWSGSLDGFRDWQYDSVMGLSKQGSLLARYHSEKDAVEIWDTLAGLRAATVDLSEGLPDDRFDFWSTLLEYSDDGASLFVSTSKERLSPRTGHHELYSRITRLTVEDERKEAGSFWRTMAAAEATPDAATQPSTPCNLAIESGDDECIGRQIAFGRTRVSAQQRAIEASATLLSACRDYLRLLALEEQLQETVSRDPSSYLLVELEKTRERLVVQDLPRLIVDLDERTMGLLSCDDLCTITACGIKAIDARLPVAAQKVVAIAEHAANVGDGCSLRALRLLHDAAARAGDDDRTASSRKRWESRYRELNAISEARGQEIRGAVSPDELIDSGPSQP